eukprot:30792_1
MTSSQPLPQSIQPIVVENTGPVDEKHYPIYNSAVTMCSNNNTSNSNKQTKMEIDDDNESVTYASSNNELLVKRELMLPSKTKANCTIIYNASKELQIGDEIQCNSYFNTTIFNQNTGYIINTKTYGRYSVKMNHNQRITTVSKRDNIIRIQPKHKSKIFNIIGGKEQDLFAQYLQTILPNQPTIILQQISSFLFNKYQRSIYFNYKSFEKLVKS